MGDDPKDAAEGFWARLNHPVIGVFITSAIAWNWEIIYIMFRGLPMPQATIDYINKKYLTSGNLYNLVIVPFFLTALFLGFGPWLHELYNRYKEWAKVKTTKLAPVFKFKLDELQSKYDSDMLKGKEREKGLANTITTEREISSKKISSLEKDWRAYRDTYNLRDGGQVNIMGLGNVNGYQLVTNNADLQNELSSAKKTIGDFTKEVENLIKENGELKVLLEHERKK
jgi:hypothetical protein